MNLHLKAKNMYLNSHIVMHIERAIQNELQECSMLVQNLTLLLSEKRRLLERKVKLFQCKLVIVYGDKQRIRIVSKHEDLRAAISIALRRACEKLLNHHAGVKSNSRQGSWPQTFADMKSKAANLTDLTYSIRYE